MPLQIERRDLFYTITSAMHGHRVIPQFPDNPDIPHVTVVCSCSNAIERTGSEYMGHLETAIYFAVDEALRTVK